MQNDSFTDKAFSQTTSFNMNGHSRVFSCMLKIESFFKTLRCVPCENECIYRDNNKKKIIDIIYKVVFL